MHPIRLLSKLAPKAINYDSAGQGSTVDVIDWRTAAHALSGLPADASDWAFYQFAGQRETLPRVVRNLTMFVTLFIKIRRYKIKPNTLEGLVRLSIVEFTQPVCGNCNGSGCNELNHAECNNCCGAGRLLLSNRQRCSVIGINHKSYSNTHNDIVNELMRLISDWEQAIIKNVTDKMSDAA